MRRLALTVALPVLAVLPATKCDREPTLDITFHTQIHPDGSATRRVEYLLTRETARKEGEPGWDTAPATDPLVRQFKPPQGEGWVVTDEVEADRHLRRVEALLPKAKAIDGDFVRIQGPGARPARNHVSFAHDDGEYEYVEVMVDPNSPVVAMRQVIGFMETHMDRLADRAAPALQSRGLTAGDIRKAYRDACIAPLRRALAEVDRPVWGMAERMALGRAAEDLEKCDAGVEAALLALSPGDEEPVHAALSEASDALQKEHDVSSWQWLALRAFDLDGLDDNAITVAFHATLVMPAPIVQANACVSGDTLHWDFEQKDLYGRGFEMRVLAKAPSPAP
jgi:hypothetical protein